FGLNLREGLKAKARRENWPITLFEVKVLSTVSYEETPDAWDDRLRDFGRQALPYLHDTLSRAEICAVGWGGTVGAVVSAAEQHGFVEKPTLPTLAASCGSLFEHPGWPNASSCLVERLHRILNGTTPAANHEKPAVYTFAEVPA